MNRWLRLIVRFLDASTRVHLRSSFLFSPESFKDPFPLSVQYRSVTQEAPRGGFLLRLYVAVRGQTLILLTALKLHRVMSFHSEHTCSLTVCWHEIVVVGRSANVSVYTKFWCCGKTLKPPTSPAMTYASCCAA